MSDSNFKQNYSLLNPEQKDAVDSIYGPIMVVAGPGTGKTQIIGMRVANILDKIDIKPENIFVTTFTEAGVIAIRERLISFMGNEGYKVGVSTIHSFSSEVIKTFPEKFIKYKANDAIDDVDGVEILSNIITELHKNKKIENLVSDYDIHFYLRDIKARIGNLKGEGVTLEKFGKLILSQESLYSDELAEIKPTLKKYETTKLKQEKHILKLRDLLIIWEEYENTLRNTGRYDFNDMINFVLEAFRSDKSLLYHYAEKFQFVMLDEYQDTNNAQNEIINLILSVSETPNIMVVGDDDQSIYRFAGANIENMLDFSLHYKDTRFIVLKNNYRSTQNILDLSSKLIDNNFERLSKKIDSIEKKLISSGGHKEDNISVKLYKATSDIDEKAYILDKINHPTPLLSKEGSRVNNLNDIAIIVRGNREVQEWSDFLQSNQIEIESKLKTNILTSNYINLILKYLNLINDPYNNQDELIDILRTGITGINQVDIFKLNRYLYIKNYSKKFKITLFDLLLEIEKFGDNENNELELTDIKEFIEFRENLISLNEKLNTLSFVEFFNDFLDITGILDFVENKGDFNDVQDIFTFFNKIKEFTSFNKNFGLKELLSKISLYKKYNYPISRQILKMGNKGVQIMTAHSSKGLEYETVFIPGLYTGNWDSKRIVDRLKLPEGVAGDGLQKTSGKNNEEDRRLFFVALTRAKKELYLSYPAGIGTKPLLQSSFIEELGEEVEEVKSSLSENLIKDNIISSLKNEVIEYSNIEFDYISEFLENYRLSPSDLNVFLEDPKLFLRRVVFKYPFIDNEFTIFGKVYHRTLELFYLEYKKNDKLPNKDYLTSTFNYLIEKEVLTSDELEKLKNKGVKGLSGYYDLHNETILEPLFLEYSFRHKNIEFNGVPLSGTIDKVESVGNPQFSPHPTSLLKGEGIKGIGQQGLFRDDVVLIDYKTGKSKSIGQIKGLDRYGNKKEGEGKYFRQLMFYKLLCELDSEFNSKFNVSGVALDFVEGRDDKYNLVNVEITSEEYEYFKNEIIDSWEKIKNIDFWKKVLEN